MKKIAHFVEYFPIAGNDYIYNQVVNNSRINSLLIAESLVRNGSPYNLTPFYYNKYSRFSFLNRVNNELNDRILNKLYIKRFNTYARKVMEDNKISIMHAHFGSAGYKLIDLKKKLNMPLVVTFYGWDVSYCLKNPLWLSRFRPMFEAADRLIVLCDEVRERLLNLGCLADKVRVWNIGMDLDKFPYQKRVVTCKDGVKLLTAARFVEKKGYPVLIKAVSILIKKGKRVYLTVLGYGPLKKSIERMVSEMGLKEVVTLIDTREVSDFDGLYSRILPEHDIFVLPSVVANDGDDEGGPALSLLCAQAAGLPVVATRFAGASRSIIDKETGIFVRDNDPRDLADKLDHLVSHPDTWNKLGEAGSDYARRNFSLNTQLKALDDIYASLA